MTDFALRLKLEPGDAVRDARALGQQVQRALGNIQINGNLIDLGESRQDVQDLTADVLKAKAALSSIRGEAGLTDPKETAELTKQVRLFQEAQRYKQNLANIEGAGLSAEDAANARALAAELNRLNLEQIEQEFQNASGAVEAYTRSLEDAERRQQLLDQGLAALAVGAGAIAGTIGALSANAIRTGAALEQLESALKNAFGEEQGSRELERIQEFAANTPFQVDALTESFLKLVNRGFVPTNEELENLGDFAASQAKDFDQFVEALLDAQTGEFERLKEFGIQASRSGDQVTLAFRGMQQTVENTPEAIREVLLGFGDLEGIQGSLAAQSATLAGQYSNLQDGLDQVNVAFFEFAEGGAKSALGVANDLVSGFLALPAPIQNSLFAITGFAGVLAAALSALIAYNLAVKAGAVEALNLAVAQLKGAAGTVANTTAKKAAVVAETALAVATGRATAAQTAQVQALSASALKLGLIAAAVGAAALAWDTYNKATSALPETEAAADRVSDALDQLYQAQIDGAESAAEATELTTAAIERQRQAVEESLGGFQQFLDKVREMLGLGTLLEDQLDSESLRFTDIAADADDLLDVFDRLAAGPEGLADATAAETEALQAAVGEAITALESVDASNATNAASQQAYLTRLRQVQEQLGSNTEAQDELTDSTEAGAEAAEAAADALREQQRAAGEEINQARADEEREISRQIDDERRARQEENARRVGAIEEQNAAQLAELEARQQEELQSREQAFEEQISAFESEQQADLQAREATFNEQQRAAEEAFQEQIAARQEALAQQQEKRNEAQLANYTEAERLLALEGAQTEEERRQIEREAEIADRIASLDLANQILNPEQLVQTAREIAQVGTVTTEEEARRVQQVLEQLQQEQQRQQQEADAAAEAQLQAQIQAEEEKFRQFQQQQRLTFEQQIGEQRQQIEAEVENRRLNFEQNILTPLRQQQEAEVAAVRAEQEAELANLRQQFADEERVRDRQHEDERIARERAFREQQRQLDLANAEAIAALQRRSNSGSTTPEARRMGGPVVAGQPYIVGETGQELFTPYTDGHVWTARETAAILRNAAANAPTVRVPAVQQTDTRLLRQIEGLRKDLAQAKRPNMQNTYQIVNSDRPYADVVKLQGDLLASQIRGW
ncbi:MAG: hypothetical protein AAFX78_02030 [Cyanobacteria bacterium J06638_20]